MVRSCRIRGLAAQPALRKTPPPPGHARRAPFVRRAEGRAEPSETSTLFAQTGGQVDGEDAAPTRTLPSPDHGEYRSRGHRPSGPRDFRHDQFGTPLYDPWLDATGCRDEWVVVVVLAAMSDCGSCLSRICLYTRLGT